MVNPCRTFPFDKNLPVVINTDNEQCQDYCWAGVAGKLADSFRERDDPSMTQQTTRTG